MQLINTIIILIMITIFLAVFVPMLLKTFSGNLDFIHKILGTSDYEKAFREASNLEKYIVCVYETCKEGINNGFCSELGITPYNPKLQTVYELLGFEFPKEGVCGGDHGYADQFPLVVHIKEGDIVNRDKIRALSEDKIKCINSDNGNVYVLINEYGDDDFFETTNPDNSDDCKPKYAKYYNPAYEVRVKKSGIVYVWDKVIQPISGGEIHEIMVKPYGYFINLTSDEDHTDEIYIYSAHSTLRRIHYNGVDYFIYLCPKATPGGNCNNVDDASDENAYDVKICNVDEEYCETKDLKKNQPYTFYDIRITYNGIASDSHGHKYMKFTVKAV
ncbi:MAG: hypothetical protein J7K83_03515 [Candidatus Aenigmarchaeota archaeon]|nr:hypothetical protein [Candidatus Aenigmarchaeota archaeon]